MTSAVDLYITELKGRTFFKCDSCGRTAMGNNFTRALYNPEGLQCMARTTTNMHAPNHTMPAGWSAAGNVHICPECRTYASNAQDNK